MKILLTNDDGIDAPGLRALLTALPAGWSPVVVAPVGAQTGCTHAATTGRGVRVEDRGNNHFAVHGTPVDCVRLALHTLAPDVAWVLSGVNAGGNLGADIYYSGTVAAAREGAIHAKPGIAFSHYKKKGRDFDWEAMTNYTRRLLAELTKRPVAVGEFWNVNYPHVGEGEPTPRMTECQTDRHPLPLDYVPDAVGWLYSGDYHNRARAAGTDVDVCFGGDIAVAKLSI